MAFKLTKLDLSSWTAWASWALTFWLASHFEPAMADDIGALGRGLAVMVLPIGFFFGAVVALQRYMRLSLTAAHYGAPGQLVTGGPFSVSRNPIYVAFLVPLVSFAYYSPLAALIGTAFYLAVMTQVVIAREEIDLGQAFPETFPAYRARTPRWLFL